MKVYKLNIRTEHRLRSCRRGSPEGERMNGKMFLRGDEKMRADEKRRDEKFTEGGEDMRANEKEIAEALAMEERERAAMVEEIMREEAEIANSTTSENEKEMIANATEDRPESFEMTKDEKAKIKALEKEEKMMARENARAEKEKGKEELRAAKAEAKAARKAAKAEALAAKEAAELEAIEAKEAAKAEAKAAKEAAKAEALAAREEAKAAREAAKLEAAEAKEAAKAEALAAKEEAKAAKEAAKLEAAEAKEAAKEAAKAEALAAKEAAKPESDAAALTCASTEIVQGEADPVCASEASTYDSKSFGKKIKKGASDTVHTSAETTYNANGTGRKVKGGMSRLTGAVLAAALAMGTFGAGMWFTGKAEEVYADDLVNTVPNEEVPGGGDFYSGTINTGLGEYGPGTQTPDKVIYKGNGPDYGPYNSVTTSTGKSVYQSQSTASPTSFAAGLPLGTIFIDQEMVNTKRHTAVAEVVSKNQAIIAGLDVNIARTVDGVASTNTVGYDGTRPGAIPMVPGKINELKGDLVKVTFADAAILPNGDRADLVITYSNARIVIDERYMAAPDGLTYYEVKRYADTNNVTPAPTSVTRVTGDTYDGYPVYRDGNGFLYYLKSGKYYRIFEISPVESQPVNPSATTEKFTYNGKQYTVYTADGKSYIKPDNERYYHGAVTLAQGNSISYGGTDPTDMTVTYGNAAVAIVDATAQGFGETYPRQNKGNDPTKPNNNVYPTTGLTMDATYQIVNKDGTPAAGTFVFAICGINLDRDPDAGTGTNTAKPLWYSYDANFVGTGGTGGENGIDYSFFSEAMEIRGGQKSQYVYVRPNTNQEDNPDKIRGVKGQYFYPNVSLHNGNIKFIGNQVDANLSGVTGGLGGNDNSYNAGFVTLADAADGFKVTATGHGNAGAGMNSLVFNSKEIWYRYTSSTGSHGKIETTSEGNWGGKLEKLNENDEILGPVGYYENNTRKKATYVVAEGKTITYTMTPDIGYKLKSIKLGKTLNPDYDSTLPDSDPNSEEFMLDEVLFDQNSVSSMKKGDSLTVTTRAGHDGILTYEENGTYTFKYVYAESAERIHVEWEPTTADILVSKVWEDNDDEDGARRLAYSDSATEPKFKLQYSVNGGRNWSDVTNNKFINNPATGTVVEPERVIGQKDVPDGYDDQSDIYKDGTYVINDGTKGSYDQTPADPQPDPSNLEQVKDTCDSLEVYRDKTTFKSYVKPGNDYHLVRTVDHPFTWEHLPVYTYDDNGIADRLISYRIVEIPDPAVDDYKKAQYFDAEAFELTSETSKSWDGWQIYSGGGKNYIKKGDGQYYTVNADGTVGEAADPQPDPTGLSPRSSSSYRTVDKAIPFQSVEVLNEHTVRKYYVDVNKFWNDAGIKDLTATGVNDYARIKLKYALHGVTDNGRGGTDTVDLNDDPDKEDLEIELDPGETNTRNKVIDTYYVFKDSSGK